MEEIFSPSSIDLHWLVLQVCIPYLDPALTQSRQQVFQYTYGFICECGSCTILRQLGQAPEPPQSPDGLETVHTALRQYVGIDEQLTLAPSLPTPSLADLPDELRCVLHESYMERLSDQFGKTSHKGEYNIAIESGITLLALYLLVYPKNYPQIGESSPLWPNCINSCAIRITPFGVGKDEVECLRVFWSPASVIGGGSNSSNSRLCS